MDGFKYRTLSCITQILREEWCHKAAQQVYVREGQTLHYIILFKDLYNYRLCKSPIMCQRHEHKHLLHLKHSYQLITTTTREISPLLLAPDTRAENGNCAHSLRGLNGFGQQLYGLDIKSIQLPPVPFKAPK